MSEEQIEVSYRELDKIYITCECGCGLIVDCKGLLKDTVKRDRPNCPGCGKALHDSWDTVLLFGQFLKATQAAESIPDPKPPEKRSEARTKITFRKRATPTTTRADKKHI